MTEIVFLVGDTMFTDRREAEDGALLRQLDGYRYEPPRAARVLSGDPLPVALHDQAFVVGNRVFPRWESAADYAAHLRDNGKPDSRVVELELLP